MQYRAYLAQFGTYDNADPKASKPPLDAWTYEVEALANIEDRITHLTWVVGNIMASSPSAHPEGTPRPETLLGKLLKKAEHTRRKTKHESLVARMLPHKAQSTG